MLQTLYDYALDYWGKNGVGIMVNALAGSSHSVNSYHVRNTNAIKSCQEILQHVLQFDPVLWRDNGRAVQRPRLSLRGAHRILQVCSTRYLGIVSKTLESVGTVAPSNSATLVQHVEAMRHGFTVQWQPEKDK